MQLADDEIVAKVLPVDVAEAVLLGPVEVALPGPDVAEHCHAVLVIGTGFSSQSYKSSAFPLPYPVAIELCAERLTASQTSPPAVAVASAQPPQSSWIVVVVNLPQH